MIEVGEYYRTKKGLIRKVKTVNTPETRKEKGFGYRKRNVLLVNGVHTLEDIETHSFNTIDLTKIGDYVNGELVIDIIEYWETLDDGTEEYRGRKLVTQYRTAQFKGTDMKYYIYQADIKTILTKELFEANCYKVKEEIC